MKKPITKPQASSKLRLMFTEDVGAKCLRLLGEGYFITAINLEDSALKVIDYNPEVNDPKNCFILRAIGKEIHLIKDNDVSVLLGKFKPVSKTSNSIYFERVPNFYLILFRESLVR